MKRLAMGVIALSMVFGSIILLVRPSIGAQEEPCPPAGAGTPEATATVVTSQRLLAQADFSELPPVPARLTTSRLTLAPGSSTQPFVNPGPVIIVVEEGIVTITADAALIGPPPEPQTGIGIAIETPPPAAVQNAAVRRGEQIVLTTNTQAQLRNDSATGVRLLLISLVPIEDS